jgi:hypothetical protein
VERWPVKTLTDPPRGSSTSPRVRRRSRRSALCHARPSRPHASAGVETTTYRVRARLVAFKVEADFDVHFVIADPKTGGTMIAEFPASYCTIGAPQHDRVLMALARQSLVRACGPGFGFFATLSGAATVSAVGFLDFGHGQRGVAPNAIELDPVLAFTSASCSQAP